MVTGLLILTSLFLGYANSSAPPCSLPIPLLRADLGSAAHMKNSGYQSSSKDNTAYCVVLFPVFSFSSIQIWALTQVLSSIMVSSVLIWSSLLTRTKLLTLSISELTGPISLRLGYFSGDLSSFKVNIL